MRIELLNVHPHVEYTSADQKTFKVNAKTEEIIKAFQHWSFLQYLVSSSVDLIIFYFNCVVAYYDSRIFGANTFCSSFQRLWEMKEDWLLDADRKMVPELNQRLKKTVQRASLCDLKERCERGLWLDLDDPGRQDIWGFITKPQSAFLKTPKHHLEEVLSPFCCIHSKISLAYRLP